MSEWCIYFTSEFALCVLAFRDAIRYCFGPVIEQELCDIVTKWNNHCIRRNSSAEAPGGIPNILYLLPETTSNRIILNCCVRQLFTYSGTQDYKCKVNRYLLCDAKHLYGYQGLCCVLEPLLAQCVM